MKFIHLSDLHLGKRWNEYSLLDDQKYILSKIIEIAENEKPDGIIIAGDVYDKSIPSAEAVELFDDFLVSLAELNLAVYIISGNHDSVERLSFGGRIMSASNIYISPSYTGKIQPIVKNDKYGEINIYLLPFVKPANVRRFYADFTIDNYTEALDIIIKEMRPDTSKRNILVCHQFITGAKRCESETVYAGGLDNVDAAIFADFDYVALGHIHGSQNINSDRIRYCGTPLKYSLSEIGHEKSVTIVELKDKGTVSVRTIPLTPKRNVLEIRGTYDELVSKSYYDGTTLQEDYVHVTLTDENDVSGALGKMRVIYHNIIKFDYDNTRTHTQTHIESVEDVEQKSPLELCKEFYRKQNGVEMSCEQEKYISSIIEKIWEDEQ